MKNSKLSLAVKFVLTAVVLYFVILQIRGHWTEISQYDWQFHVWPIVLSVTVALMALYLFATCWKWVIAGFGHDLSSGRAFRIAYLSNLGRYIPGKVWQLFGMLYLAGKEGIPAERAASSFVITQLFAIPASFLAFFIASTLRPSIIVDQLSFAGERSSLIGLGIILALSVTLVIRPQPFLWLANALLRLFGRQPVDFALDKRVALLLFGGYFLGWILYGIAFWLFLVGVNGFRGPDPVAAVGIFNGSYQIGYLALFAPGGFGPRELAMGQMLVPFLGSVGPAFAIAARLWSIVIESIAAIWALALKK